MELIKWVRSLFAWQTMHETGIWSYQENSITGARRALRNGQGYQPIDQHWLDRVEYIKESIPPSTHDKLTEQNTQDAMNLMERNNIPDIRLGPVYLPKSLYQLGKKAGHDMTGYRIIPLIPKAKKKRPR